MMLWNPGGSTGTPYGPNDTFFTLNSAAKLPRGGFYLMKILSLLVRGL